MTAALVFDGDCAFCSTCARWLERRVPTPATITAWQHTDLAALGLTPEACSRAIQWTDGERHAEGADAFVALLRSSSSRVWRAAGRALGSGPGLVAARPVYGWVARHRHRLPGGTPACALRPPSDGLR